jgi:hypothetical protein
LQALESPGSNAIHVLVRLLPILEPVYAKYCSGIPGAQALYNRKLSSKDFMAFEQSFATMNKPTLNYIMRPVQVPFGELAVS